MEPYQKEMLLSAMRSFGTCDVVVMGESMKPFIQSGDTVSLSSIVNVPRIGEVVAFFNENQLLVHRIIRRKRLSSGDWDLWVWGDSSPGMPGRVSLKQCIGKVVRLSRNDRSGTLWIRTPFRIVALFAGIVLRAFHLLKK